MNIKLFLSGMLILAGLIAAPAHAINTVKDASLKRAWGYSGGKSTYGEAPGFIMDGGLGKEKRGTWDDEFGVVAMVASSVVEHGGYFCPYQVQCSNSNGSAKTWTTYYLPRGFDKNKCLWLCETGYAGANCTRHETPPVAADVELLRDKLSDLYMAQSGSNVENLILGFDQWGKDPEHDVVLGVIQVLEHGVIAGPVQIKCARTQSRYVIDSWIDAISLAAPVQNYKVLCEEGYMANSSGNDCMLIDPTAYGVALLNFCDGYARSDYNPSKHTLRTENGCTKYMCTDSGTAFADANTKECSACERFVSETDGTCVKCATGMYLNQTSNQCETADAFSRTDMQYGKNKTRSNNSSLYDQCWTVMVPDEYVDCVRSGGLNLSGNNLKR